MTNANRPTRLRITILLPQPGWKPVGGFKVAYEYANYLAGRGHTIHVVHANLPRIDKPLFSFPPKMILHYLRRYLILRATGGYRPDAWFALDPKVRLTWAQNLSEGNVPSGDIVIATSWETAEWACEYPESKGRSFYLIQHLETWSGPEARVMATWKAPLEKIVISSWLKRVAFEMGESSHLISNGLDFRQFRLTTPPEQRDPHNLLMIHHLVEWKGTGDGLAAFEIARQSIPELRLRLFGVNPLAEALPEGVDFLYRPSQKRINELYNEAAIFVGPSWAEGWPLPPAEALICGCALAVTDRGADESYAIEGQTALRSPIKDPEALAANIVRLVRDTDLRLRLSRRGTEQIGGFTWQRAGEALEAVLLSRAK